MPSYEQWVRYTFGLDGGSSMLEKDALHPYPGPPEEILRHCLTFFHKAPATLESVPRELACKALWMLPGIDGWLGVLSRMELSIESRFELAGAHFDLFKSTFAEDDFAGAAFMWWESLAGASYAEGPPIHDDPEICDRLLLVIERILYLDSEVCQRCALHGVNEIGPYCKLNPDHVVNRYLRSNAYKIPALKKYAIEVLEGQAQ